MKFNVSFYRSGDHNSKSLIANCIVDANNNGEALDIAKSILSQQYPEVSHCIYHSVETHQGAT